MAFERIMGIEVIDEEKYRQYRERMTPILHSYGASFGYDFRVSEVLLSKTPHPVNRVFTIEFPDREIMERFFNDPDYVVISKEYLMPSISEKTVISMHDK